MRIINGSRVKDVTTGKEWVVSQFDGDYADVRDDDYNTSYVLISYLEIIEE